MGYSGSITALKNQQNQSHWCILLDNLFTYHSILLCRIEEYVGTMKNLGSASMEASVIFTIQRISSNETVTVDSIP